VEINRKLYMDEQTLETHDGFQTLRGHLRQLVQQLLVTDPRKLD
jgi:N-formylglutamate deformylase